MHSYWDDFWALKGYDGAIDIATALSHNAEADRLRGERDTFRRDLVDSLHAAVAARGIAYLPGAAELGDFDPTSTAIAFAPRGDIGALRSDLVRATYEPYWREFTDQRDRNKAWDEYTPYELRVVGTWCGWAGETARRRCSRSFSPTGARWRGTSGPKSSAAIRASRASSATCRTPG
jgi:hypothetical protein